MERRMNLHVSRDKHGALYDHLEPLAPKSAASRLLTLAYLGLMVEQGKVTSPAMHVEKPAPHTQTPSPSKDQVVAAPPVLTIDLDVDGDDLGDVFG